MNEFNRENNLGVWFDVPVKDLDRATTFYAEILSIQVSKQNFNDVEFSVLEHKDGNGGCLVPRTEEVTSESGILVYFNVHGRLHDAVDKTLTHGGKIVLPIHPIGPHGFRSIILDSEGNRIALHSEVDV
ncbi:MAG: VOC family protein [Verrucomicrobia bacterium]|jgi:uncharacterized protein|nr:VOC family protein [Verrucomicrobiota bacterium]